MLPILYAAAETDFDHNGLGLLRDTLSATVTEELNGPCTLDLTYDAEGFLADELVNEAIIKAKANDVQEPQLFRVAKVEKDQEDDTIKVSANHITYDLAGNLVLSLVLDKVSTAAAMQAIQDKMVNPSPFTLSSDSDTVASTSLYRLNPLQMVGGVEGSVLDNWGGEIERDNFNLIMHKQRGADNGVLVAWRKNLTGLTAVFDLSNVRTRLYPFAIINNTLLELPDKYVDSPHLQDYALIRFLPIDYSQDQDVVGLQSMQDKVATYFADTLCDLPDTSLDVSFEPLWQTEEYKAFAVLERIGLGDTVTIRNDRLGVSVKERAVKIEFDCLTEKNTKVSVGKLQANFTDTVASLGTATQSGINDALDTAQAATSELFQVKGTSKLTLGTQQTALLSKGVAVDTQTAFVVGFVVQVNVTTAGFINLFFTLNGNRLDAEVKQTVGVGWYTFGFPFLVGQIQPERQSLVLFATMTTGAATVDVSDVEMYISSRGTEGGDSNDAPNPIVSETYKLVMPAVTTHETVSAAPQTPEQATPSEHVNLDTPTINSHESINITLGS